LDVTYSQRERFWLWALAVTGFLVVNGAFLYGLLFQPEAMAIAMRNPISVAFMIEALLLLGAFTYLLPRWGVSRLSSAWFVILSLVGSMAFALPVVLLWGRRRRRSAEGREPSPGP
jgi:hypothetical protein